ncbi:MBL fold metallo-hydrolase [Mucilaginibacter sp. CSA2-8R]|uniref:MBL fold metallo-hydrolase n=1 Tax=Mucilaginibacter sp. CSA2-8R TaxID=3141542 RepID=UPI00315D9675
MVSKHLYNLTKYIFLLLIFPVLPGCAVYKTTGHNPSGADLKAIKKLANYSEGKFQNIDSSGVDFRKASWTKLLKTMRDRPANVKPPHPLPVVKTDLNTVYSKPTVIWFGHSTFLIKTPEANILVDPDFSGYAGPTSWFVKAFDGSEVYKVDDLPPLDILLISHDHYDHLDYKTVKQLQAKVKHVVVPMGIGSHFRYWGYKTEQIHELNWHQSYQLPSGLNITVTPSRHESGRLFAKQKTLWGSFVIKTDNYKIFYSGDSAYGRHYKQIGQQYGPFDLAIMECGQYNKLWPRNHMFPEQTAQAAADLSARMILPVHWGKFAESNHPWNESVKRLLPAAQALYIPVTIPQLGQPYTLDHAPLQARWFD